MARDNECDIPESDFVRCGGPEEHGKRYRVVRITTDGRRRHRYFEDKEGASAEVQARIYVLEFREQRGKRSVMLGVAVTEYLEHLRLHGSVTNGKKRRPVQAPTLRIVRSKLEGILRLVDPDLRKANRGRRRPLDLPIIDREIGSLTPHVAAGLYKARVTAVKPDTHQSELLNANAFGNWCVLRGYLKANPFANVLPEGDLSCGKETLTVDEAQKVFEIAIRQEIHPILDFAVASIMVFGTRVSEVLKRTVRDLDVGGTVLRLTKTKSRAGERNMVIPEMLRPGFQRLAQAASNGMLVRGQSGPAAKLFGTTTSGTILKHVAKLCTMAGVPVVTTHGLRGSHLSNAHETGTPLKSVSAAAGHANTSVTINHYIRPGVMETVRARENAALLTGNSTSTVPSKVQVEVVTDSESLYPDSDTQHLN